MDDTGRDVEVSRSSFKHDWPRGKQYYYGVFENYGEILKRSIIVNEAEPNSGDMDTDIFAAIGLAEDENGQPYVVRSIIKRHPDYDEIRGFETVYAIRPHKIKSGKSGAAPAQGPRLSGLPTGTTLHSSGAVSPWKVADVLDAVKDILTDTFVAIKMIMKCSGNAEPRQRRISLCLDLTIERARFGRLAILPRCEPHDNQAI